MAAETAAANLLRRWAALVGPWGRAAAGLGTLHGFTVIAQAGLIAALAQAVLMDGADLMARGDLVIALAVVVTGRAAARWGQLRCAAEAGARIRVGVRDELLDHLARIGPQPLSEQHSAGTASRVVEQVEALDGYFSRYLPQLWLTVAVPAAILATVFALDWVAGIFLALSAPLIPLFMALVGMGAERLQRQHFDALTRLAGHFLDRVRGLSTLQLFGYGPRSVEEVAAAADGYRVHTMATLRVAFLSSAVLEFFASVAIAVVAIYVGFGLLGYITVGPAGELTLFSGLFVLMLAPEFFQPLRNLAQHYHDRAAAVGAATEIQALLDLAPPAPVASVDPALAPGALCLEDVGLAYPVRGRVVGPLSLTVEPGETVVLQGASGSGKSSLLRALGGFEPLSEGGIRRGPGAVSWLGQRPFIMRGTIRENIRLGQPGADDQRVEAAARQAGVADFARLLPGGLDTLVGERGQGLSGGQAQRVALARLFLSAASLALLDEPTAGLDAESEAAVLAALRHLASSGRTLVIATHQPAIVSRADRVLVLGETRVTDEADSSWTP